MTALLYRWPAAAKFGRTVPKTKFYEHGTVSGAVRDKFVSEVQRITWAYKLAQATINLPGNTDVPEIQVFQIDTKGDDVSESVLAAIDKAVKTPIIFEIVTGEGDEQRVRMAASHKQVGPATPKLSAYYTTDWQTPDAERQPLPTAISLPSLYTALLAPLTPVSARPGEELSDVAERLQTVSKLEREVASLERKLRAEPQLNRKVELRRALKTKQAELEQQR
ncbi:DUF4391 domain-containing protein [Mycolicibacterium holsaticum]|uniref:DUF4391 domain-containing protein n=1 Tax=Mycolicibacterium holsaticum TaxID=152142 RepID=A0A1E3RZ84_9MYCO|nr:DUF4391 domain-containing protein [Mycolicibacterium holsaticum]MCF6390658.1 DUF4391 domain-containing protein [Mycobacterium sp. MBM]MCH9732995.1 DUF4391 domain-containing protein [Actinomycetes bacterium]ODQ95159.1 hypothetical protein BHQ17_06285 [Mycolicibacterium holsaticum]